jgi:hypothetical protein
MADFGYQLSFLWNVGGKNPYAFGPDQPERFAPAPRKLELNAETRLVENNNNYPGNGPAPSAGHAPFNRLLVGRIGHAGPGLAV